MRNVLELERRLLGEGKADRTVREYVKWGKRLARWCQLHDLDLARLEPHELRRWADSTIPDSRESRKQAYTACKHLYIMLGRTDQPWCAIRVPAKPKSKPHPLSEPDRVRLRDAAIMVGGRQGVATLGLLQTAARPVEVAGWRWDGIDADRLIIRFWRPKTREWHEVPLRPALLALIERYRPPHAEGFMFPGNNGAPHVQATTVLAWTRRVAEVAGVRDVTPRRLRATCATRALDVTHDIDAVASLLGHRSTDVTRRHYATTSNAALMAASAALD